MRVTRDTLYLIRNTMKNLFRHCFICLKSLDFICKCFA